MKKIVYPLIATALITITPFLVTFENGQDIVRGLFCYSILILSLLFVYVKAAHWRLKFPLLVLIFAGLILVSIGDLQNILSYKGWNVEWRVLIPIATCSLAIYPNCVKANRPTYPYLLIEKVEFLECHKPLKA